MYDQSDSRDSDGARRFDGSSRHTSFPSTNWPFIEKIQGEDQAEADQAYNAWVARYWRPLTAYFRSRGKQSADAKDLTQGLVWHLYEKKKFQQLEPRSHLRKWLLVMAENWMVDEYRRENKSTRKPPQGFAVFSEILHSTDEDLPVIAVDDPEAAFLASWRKEVLERAMEATRHECLRSGREQDYEIFQKYYVIPQEPVPEGEPANAPTWEDLAREYHLDSARVASGRGDWVRKRFARFIYLEIRRYVDSEDDVNDEIVKLCG